MQTHNGLPRQGQDERGRFRDRVDATFGDSSELVGLLANAILRRWRIVLLVAITMVSLVYGVLQAMDDVYNVRASLLVRVGRENLEVPAAAPAGSLVSTGVRKEDINSDVSLIGSRALAERTVDALGLKAFMPERPPPETVWQSLRRAVGQAARWGAEAAETVLVALRLTPSLSLRDKIIARAENDLLTRREGDSDVILINFRTRDPALGVRFVNQHIEHFMEQRSVARRSTGVSQFFADRVRESRERLDDLDRRVGALRAELSLASVEQERANLLARSAHLDTQLAAAASASSVAEALARFMPGAGDAAQSGSGAQPAAVRARIGELIIERATLLEKFKAGAQPLREVEARVGQLTALLDRSAAKEIAVLSGEKAAIDARLEVLNRGELLLDRLTLERGMARERYSEHRKQLDAAEVGAELERRRVANVSVLTPPTADSRPDSPRRLVIFAVSLPLALLLGVAVAAVLSHLDPRIFTRIDLARASGLPVLGAHRSAARSGASAA